MAHSFRHGRPTIGVLPGWQFFRTATVFGYLKPVFNGISRAALDLQCNLLFACGMGATASPADPIHPAWPDLMPDTDYVPIGPANTDGLIIFNPLHSTARSQYIQNLRNTGYPVVFIGSGETGSTVVADNSSGIFEAIGHLVQHGHQRIAFIAGSPDDMKGDSGDRLRAYQSAMVNHGLDYDHRIVAYGRHIYDGGLLAMRQILASSVPFSAVLASNDESAHGAMQALKEAGHQIPQDIAVIGFDNRLENVILDPPLSSVHIPLFQLGYRAVELLLKHLESETETVETIKVNTRLIRRESCGCGRWRMFSIQDEVAEMASDPPFRDSQPQRLPLAQTIANTILDQAQNLVEEECQALSLQLVESFRVSLDKKDGSAFVCALEDVLQRTVSAEEDANIWQDALSLLKASVSKPSVSAHEQSNLVDEILDQARLIISLQMQRQHRRTIIEQRWSNSRLILLTASLQTALEESHIYEILAEHLPNMEIYLALIVIFEAVEDNPIANSVLRNALKPEIEPIHFVSCQFPPAGLFGQDQAFQLALIPLVNQTGQLGYVAFGTDHFELYGNIVQQLAAALNTAQLYKQATEGRRLAEEANRMKSRFLSTISHELRTPLNLIVGLSGILLDEDEEGKTNLADPVHKDIERIHAYAQHLGGLIGDVLDLATNDAGQLRLNMELIDLSETLRLVVDSGRQLATDKGLAWKANLPDTGPWVWGDRTRLRQVVLNFINNAVKFTTCGEIGLTVESNEGYVTVQVRDTGLGIPPEEHLAIFNEFRRSERSIALGYPGSGLGLAISKMLIQMHAGKIGVESTGIEGEGARFYFILPTVQPPLEKPSPNFEAPILRATVLMLTARENANERLRELLNQRGVKMHTIQMERVSEWQSVLYKSPPDAIILDVSIHSDLGWNTLRSIKSSRLARGIPIIFYSSSAQGDAVLNLDYLTKPIELSDLTQAFDHVRLMVEPDQPTQTFLIVDDEPSTLEMHARIVQSQSSSFRVLQAQDGYQALDILQQEKIDVVLLDLQMPGLDGFGVLDAMRANDKTRDIPVIVVTGKVLTEQDMVRLNQGVATVLSKGLFSIEETAAHIGNALERKRKLSQDAQRLVRQAMAYIHEHYSEQISRRDIAQRVSIAEDHLTYCFRQELGITPIKYLQRFRVNQAKLLLKTSQKTITEIAFSVGFTDSGYFSRIFHRETGASPEDYRLTH